MFLSNSGRTAELFCLHQKRSKCWMRIILQSNLSTMATFWTGQRGHYMEDTCFFFQGLQQFYFVKMLIVVVYTVRQSLTSYFGCWGTFHNQQPLPSRGDHCREVVLMYGQSVGTNKLAVTGQSPLVEIQSRSNKKYAGSYLSLLLTYLHKHFLKPGLMKSARI